MNYYEKITLRIDNIYRQIYSKTLQYKKAVKDKRLGLAQVFAEEILDLKSLLRLNQEIMTIIFHNNIDQEFHVN